MKDLDEIWQKGCLQSDPAIPAIFNTATVSLKSTKNAFEKPRKGNRLNK
jgi:hypothetical protein